jgi:hypothetical protein
MRHRDRLPVSVPNGTKYVIEGRNGNIFSEYLEFPNGRRVELLVNGKASRLRGKRAKHQPKAAA